MSPSGRSTPSSSPRPLQGDESSPYRKPGFIHDRFLVMELVKRDFKARYDRSVLGMFWCVLQPTLTMGLLYTVFSVFFKNAIPNFPLYLISGIVLHQFFVETTTSAMRSIQENAALILSKDKERIRREEGRTIGAVREIGALLGLKDLSRMEAYDISNISGYDSVGSMVVYEDGKPKKNDYRKFRIRGVTGANDYDSLREVLTRRLTHGLSESGTGFARLPDLIFMDGGLGQVGVALEVLDEFHLAIPVCGMVKDDRHRTSDLIFEGEAIRLDHHSQAFRLVERIQDEAHRFAITYHRDLRSKGQTHSLLDDIPGIGPARRKALMGAFSSLEEMKNASTEELAAIPGMNSAAAASVRRFFHPEES